MYILANPSMILISSDVHGLVATLPYHQYTTPHTCLPLPPMSCVTVYHRVATGSRLRLADTGSPCEPPNGAAPRGTPSPRSYSAALLGETLNTSSPTAVVESIRQPESDLQSSESKHQPLPLNGVTQRSAGRRSRPAHATLAVTG